MPDRQTEKPTKITSDILSVDHCGTTCVITLTVRELTHQAAEELSTRLLSLINDAHEKHFVIDFQEVQFMESACFGALVLFAKWLARFDGKIALANVTPNVRFLFAVTKLDNIFPILQDVPKALKAVES